MATTYTTTGTKAVWGYDSSGNRVIVDNIPVTTTYTNVGGNTQVSQQLASGETIKTDLITYAGSSQIGSVSGGGIIEQKTETVQVPNYVQLGNEIIQARTQPTTTTTIPTYQQNPINQYFKYGFVGGTKTGEVYLRPENMQTPPPPEKFSVTRTFATGVNTIFGGKTTTQVGFSPQEELETRQIIMGELDRTKTPFMTNPLRWTGETVNPAFSKQENIGGAYQQVYNRYIGLGYAPEVAYYKTQIASERFIRDTRGELFFETAVGIGSNVIGGVLVSSSQRYLPIVFKGASNKAVYYGSRALGMGTAGAFEGISFAQARSSFTTKAQLSGMDYLFAGVLGAGSSFGAQVFIETGAKGLVGLAKPRAYTNVLKTGTGVGGTTVRESALKFFDPLEEVSDSATRLADIPFKNVRTFPFSTNARTQPSVEQPSMGRSVTSGYVGTPTFSYTFTQTQQKAPKTYNMVTDFTETMPISARVRTQPNNLPSAFSNPRVQPNTLPEVFNRVTTRNQVIPYTQPLTSPRTQPNVFPFTNPRTQAQPQVLPNVFATDFAPVPFIPPMGGGMGKGFGFNTKTRQRKAYIPSLTAIGLGIKQKRGRKTETFSGISLRPIRS